MGTLTEIRSTASLRDRRIDFWRGLCLIDMVLVHLCEEKVQMGQWLAKFLLDYTRFAAGGFVFVAGLAIGAIFLPKAMDAEQRGGTYRRLWARSLRILGWQYVVSITWVDLMVWRGQHDPVNGMGSLLRNVVTFREGGDLLPLYVLLIALSPLLLEVRRRTRGWMLLASVSIAIFIFGRFHPYAIALDPKGNFPPLLWQLVFISGLLAGGMLRSYDRLKTRSKLLIAAAAWAAFALLFWCEYWQPLGLPRCPVSPVFAKVPLTTAELLRYLTMTLGLLTGTDLLWRRWLSGTHFAAFAATLGRCTLPVYVAHTFLIEFSGWLAAQWSSMGTWQIFFAPACLGILWLLAVAIVWRPRQPQRAIQWGGWNADAQTGRAA